MKKFLSYLIAALIFTTMNAHSQTSLGAKNDFFGATHLINGVAGGSTPSILTNDTVAGVINAATTSNVTVEWLSTAPAGITLNPDGTITVAPNTTAYGPHLFNYRICGIENPSVCSQAFATLYIDKDSDGDGVPDLIDRDDDNDGILDGNPLSYGETQECVPNLPAIYASHNVLELFAGEAEAPYNYTSSNNLFLRIRPSDFNFPDLPAIPRTPGDALTINLTATRDYSSFFGLAPGSVIVTVENANVHPFANEFYVQNALGASPRTRIKVYGSVGSYLGVEHGREYYRQQERGITFLDATTPATGLLTFPGWIQEPEAGEWASGNDGHYYYVQRLGTKAVPPHPMDTAHTSLHIANINPGMIKYIEFSTDNTESTEYSTFFFRLFPECDEDGDGIPNRLDLDSDNDGCVDALEGEDGFGSSDLVTAGGTLSVGAGSTAENQNLCATNTCVDVNGIPNAVDETEGQKYEGTYDANDISACTALPIDLSGFYVSKNQNTVLLNWTTVSEQNNKGFTIERSADGRNWTSIAFVNSKAPNGNSSIKLTYTYTDATPTKGHNYYRLRQTDFDGKYENSAVRMASFDIALTGITIFPNPARDNVTISGLAGNETISIFDATGRKIKQLKNTGAATTIDLRNFGEGVYHIQLIADDGTVTTNKIVKKQ